MKAGWEVKPLGEVTSVINGLWKGKKGPYQLAKVVRNTNFRPNGQLNLDDVAEIEVELKQLEKRRLDPGDIVLERSGGGPKQPVGRVVLFDLDEDNFSFSNFTSVIRTVDRSLLCPRFLHAQLNFWYASGVTEPLQKQSTGIRNLDFKAYQALHVLIPPLKEQKRIVAVLDAAYEGLTRAKENAEANLQNARELFVSCREESFDLSQEGWSLNKLEELITIKHGFAFKSEFFTKAGNFVLLTPGNYFEEGGYRDRGEKQKYYVGEMPDGYILSEGDLLVAMTEQAEGLLGSCILVPESDRFLHNQRLGLMQPKAGVEWHAPFFAEAFNLLAFRQALTSSSTGIKVRHTSPKKFVTNAYRCQIP